MPIINPVILPEDPFAIQFAIVKRSYKEIVTFPAFGGDGGAPTVRPKNSGIYPTKA